MDIGDDYDSEYRYNGKPSPPCRVSTAIPGGVCGTFSKVLFPAMRLGYMVAPPVPKTLFQRARLFLTRATESSNKYLTAFLEGGRVERHLRRMRRCTRNGNRRWCIGEKLLGTALRVNPSTRYMHAVGWLEQGRMTGGWRNRCGKGASSPAHLRAMPAVPAGARAGAQGMRRTGRN